MKTQKIKFIVYSFLIFTVNFSTANTWSEQSLKTEDSLGYYKRLVASPKSSSDLTNAFAFFKQRIDRHIKTDTLNVIYNLRYIAIIQFDLGLLKECESTCVSGLNYIDLIKANDSISNRHRLGLYNQLGRVYSRLEDHSSALKYYQTALQLQNNSEYYHLLINNIGLVYYDLANYEKALEFFTETHNINLTLNKPIKTARSLNNVGITMSKMGLPKSIDSLKKALKMRLDQDYKVGIFDSYLKLSDHYMRVGDLKTAKKYAVMAHQLAKVNKNNLLEVEALSLLMRINPNVNIKRYTFMIDSINRDNLNAQHRYAAKKYGLEKLEKITKENELKLKTIELDNEKQKRKMASFIFIGSLSILSIIFTFIFIKSHHKRQRLKEVYATQSSISRKIHDEVANDMYELMTVLENDSKINNVQVNKFNDIYQKTRDISKEYTVISFDDSFVEHINELTSSFQNSETNIITKGLSRMNWDKVSIINRTTIFKTIQELLINMKKHSNASLVLLIFEKENRNLHVSYSDNGIGSELKKGNGIQNTENRIQAINGIITFETNLNKGFKAKIKIKKCFKKF